jgi:outer membrane protein assembly factor BamB
MTRLLLGGLLTLTLALTLSAADWPQWRGPNRDGVSKETGLLKEWPKDGPPLRWKRTDIGTGYSTPAIAGGKVYVQTTAGDDEFALALDEKTGKDVWKAPIGKVGKNSKPEYPGTRATPTVDGDRLYCLASAGQLTCLGTDGKQRWQKDLVKDFDGQVGNKADSYNWQYSESVLVDGDALVCTPGGSTATLLKLNKMTGEVVWKCPVPGGEHADYASIIVTEAGGVRQYVQFLRKGVVGVDAKTGKFLWRYDRIVGSSGANILTPVAQKNLVFVSTQQGMGGAVELTADGGTVTAKEAYTTPAAKAGIGGAVLVDGHLYGTTGANLFCVDFATGKEKWSEPKIGPASVCYADGRLYVRSHGGTGFGKRAPSVVVLVEPSPEGYREKGRFTEPDMGEKPAWAHPVVANGGLYLRDWNTLACYEVKAGK